MRIKYLPDSLVQKKSLNLMTPHNYFFALNFLNNLNHLVSFLANKKKKEKHYLHLIIYYKHGVVYVYISMYASGDQCHKLYQCNCCQSFIQP